MYNLTVSRKKNTLRDVSNMKNMHDVDIKIRKQHSLIFQCKLYLSQSVLSLDNKLTFHDDNKMRFH
jgi:hypothetical protein